MVYDKNSFSLSESNLPSADSQGTWKCHEGTTGHQSYHYQLAAAFGPGARRDYTRCSFQNYAQPLKSSIYQRSIIGSVNYLLEVPEEI